MKKFQILILTSLSLLFMACSQHLNYAQGDEAKFAFRVNENESSVVKNPPENKTAIYMYRDGSIMGFAITYRVAYEFAPKFNKANKVQMPTLFFSRRNVYGFKELEVPSDNDKLILVADGTTEQATVVSFYPKVNQIYCVKTGVAPGWLLGRASIKLVDKATCLKEIQKLQLSSQ